VLLLGELAAGMRTEVTTRGAVITDATDAHHAFELLATTSFDVVVVDPDADGNGRDLVAAVKESADDHLHTIATIYGARGTSAFLRGSRPPPAEVLEVVRAKHRLTPFITLPADGARNYEIVVVLPDVAFIESPVRVPLVTAILFLDASRLMAKRPAVN
jgi:DNA-binding NarL/FixJ family response regulator